MANPPEIYRSASELIRDQLTRLAASRTHENRIAIIDIDEKSLATLGAWPWQRHRIADLIEALLTSYGAKRVALDLVMPSKGDQEGDARLEALAANNLLVMAIAFDFIKRESPLTTGVLAGGQTADSHAVPAEATGYVANHDGFASARCTGNIGFSPDADGVLRHIPFTVRYKGRDYPTLATALLACNKSTYAVDKYWRIPFHRTSDAYTAISASDVLDGSAPKALIKGRYVLIGSSALGLSDRVATPLGPNDVGVMVHAQILSYLLDAQNENRLVPWPATGLAVLWVLAAISFTVFIIPRVPAWHATGMLLGWAVLWLFVAYGAIASGSEFPVLLPFATCLLLLVGVLPFEWWCSQNNSRRILEMFRHYVSPGVLDELVRNHMTNSLELRQMEVTVLIADIEDYTGHTSRLSLDEAASLTRSYLDAMTRPVLAQGGTLDKYSGDGLVAFWGAPIPNEDHADRAIDAGTDILDRVSGINVDRLKRGLPEIRVRIGIESGQALVGDLGTEFRSTYTAVGDCINFASKLQEIARDVHADIIIGPGAACKAVRHELVELGTRTVKTGLPAIKVFTVPRRP